MRNILLLTATIAPPPGVPRLQRTDPQVRLDDYCKALDFYCRLPESKIHRIVLIENSGFDLSALRKVVAQAGAETRVEFVSFNGLDHSPKYGRGYGEFKLLDYAMEHSPTLTSLNRDDRLWKVTGRYRVLNLITLLRTAPAQYELYCDLRDRPIPWVDLRILSATAEGYHKFLKGLYLQLREDKIYMSPERYLRPILGELAQANPIVTRFRREPHVDGIRGLDSQNYSRGANRLKYWVRAIQRRLIPWSSLARYNKSAQAKN